MDPGYDPTSVDPTAEAPQPAAPSLPPRDDAGSPAAAAGGTAAGMAAAVEEFPDSVAAKRRNGRCGYATRIVASSHATSLMTHYEHALRKSGSGAHDGELSPEAMLESVGEAAARQMVEEKEEENASRERTWMERFARQENERKSLEVRCGDLRMQVESMQKAYKDVPAMKDALRKQIEQENAGTTARNREELARREAKLLKVQTDLEARLEELYAKLSKAEQRAATAMAEAQRTIFLSETSSEHEELVALRERAKILEELQVRHEADARAAEKRADELAEVVLKSQDAVGEAHVARTAAAAAREELQGVLEAAEQAKLQRELDGELTEDGYEPPPPPVNTVLAARESALVARIAELERRLLEFSEVALAQEERLAGLGSEDAGGGFGTAAVAAAIELRERCTTLEAELRFAKGRIGELEGAEQKIEMDWMALGRMGQPVDEDADGAQLSRLLAQELHKQEQLLSELVDMKPPPEKDAHAVYPTASQEDSIDQRKEALAARHAAAKAKDRQLAEAKQETATLRLELGAERTVARELRSESAKPPARAFL